MLCLNKASEDGDAENEFPAYAARGAPPRAAGSAPKVRVAAPVQLTVLDTRRVRIPGA